MKTRDWLYLLFAFLLSVINIILHEHDLEAARPFVAYLTGVSVGLLVCSLNARELE